MNILEKIKSDSRHAEATKRVLGENLEKHLPGFKEKELLNLEEQRIANLRIERVLKIGSEKLHREFTL